LDHRPFVYSEITPTLRPQSARWLGSKGIDASATGDAG
jgi:hypothetical protein